MLHLTTQFLSHEFHNEGIYRVYGRVMERLREELSYQSAPFSVITLDTTFKCIGKEIMESKNKDETKQKIHNTHLISQKIREYRGIFCTPTDFLYDFHELACDIPGITLIYSTSETLIDHITEKEANILLSGPNTISTIPSIKTSTAYEQMQLYLNEEKEIEKIMFEDAYGEL